jgi:Recombination endonuclease VII
VKVCKGCGQCKPLSEFGPRKRTHDGLNAMCRPCCAQRMREWTRANPGRRKQPVTLPAYRRHRLSEDAFQALLDRQAGVCAVCGGPPRDEERLVVDHDHDCCPGPRSCGQCIRGLLCPGCNQAAGILDDSAVLAERVADYLEAPMFRARRAITD